MLNYSLADHISVIIDFAVPTSWNKGVSMKAATGNPQAVAPQLVELVTCGRAHAGRVVSSVQY